MSFSAGVKSEICKDGRLKKCCAAAELYGVLLYCNRFDEAGIRILTESKPFAARLENLLPEVFGLHFDVIYREPDKRGKLDLRITDRDKIITVMEHYGYTSGNVLAHHINLGVLEEDCCRASFIRGAFLAGGSVTDPSKRYHIELVTDYYGVGREMYALFLDLGFSPKSTARGGKYITYFKQSEAIEDLLTLLGAPVAAMEVMSAKVEKDMRNIVNRKVNCDTANLQKMVNASMNQTDAIIKLEESGLLPTLSDKLRETAALRRDHPEASLAELAYMFSPPVTKSCLSHRLKKLIELAETASNR